MGRALGGLRCIKPSARTNRLQTRTRMNRTILWWLMAALVASVETACERRTPYEQWVDEALASGQRHDSLFLGIYLGMPEKAFYDHCLALNRDSIVTDGLNMTVEYLLPGFEPQATMLFFPKFAEGRIVEMPVTIGYNGWAPWNRHLWADSLLPRVIEMLERWYRPKGFRKMQVPGYSRPVHVRIDGNRQIVAYVENEQYVRVVFSDLSARGSE